MDRCFELDDGGDGGCETDSAHEYSKRRNWRNHGMVPQTSYCGGWVIDDGDVVGNAL